jgi:hypothetical protein
MSALNPGQFQQLPMFMTARDIDRQYDPNEGDRNVDESTGWVETTDELWDRKAQEAKQDASGVGDGLSVHDSVLRHGVKSPVWLYHDERSIQGDLPTVGNGHHRVAVLLHNDPDRLMPVLHGTHFFGELEKRSPKKTPDGKGYETDRNGAVIYHGFDLD